MENRAWYLATGKADVVNNASDDPERSLIQNDKNNNGAKDITNFNIDKGEIKYRESDESLKNN